MSENWGAPKSIGIQRMLQPYKHCMPLTSDKKAVRLASYNSFGSNLVQTMAMPWRPNLFLNQVEQRYMNQVFSILTWLDENCQQAWAYRMEMRTTTHPDYTLRESQIRHVLRMESRDAAMMFKLSCIY